MHGGDLWESVFCDGAQWDSLSGREGLGSGVWRGVSAIMVVFGTYRAAVAGVLVGEEGEGYIGIVNVGILFSHSLLQGRICSCFVGNSPRISCGQPDSSFTQTIRSSSSG